MNSLAEIETAAESLSPAQKQPVGRNRDCAINQHQLKEHKDVELPKSVATRR
jgi:hypothetical protein